MTDMREALDRLKMAICQLGGIDMNTGKEYTYAAISAAEAAVIALYEEQKAVADKLAEAMSAVKSALSGGGYCCDVVDAALADYNKAKKGEKKERLRRTPNGDYLGISDDKGNGVGLCIHEAKEEPTQTMTATQLNGTWFPDIQGRYVTKAELDTEHEDRMEWTRDRIQEAVSPLRERIEQECALRVGEGDEALENHLRQEAHCGTLEVRAAVTEAIEKHGGAKHVHPTDWPVCATCATSEQVQKAILKATEIIEQDFTERLEKHINKYHAPVKNWADVFNAFPPPRQR